MARHLNLARTVLSCAAVFVARSVDAFGRPAVGRRATVRRLREDGPDPPAPWEGEGAAARKAAMEAVFAAQDARARGGGPEPAVVKAREAAKFRATRDAVVGDHLFLGALAVAALWAVAPLRVAASYALGVAFGGAYLYLLGRYVGSIGEASFEGAKEGGVGQARFAVVALLVAIAGKQRAYLDFLPLLGGFFSYQVATLVQAARPPAAPAGEDASSS